MKMRNRMHAGMWIALPATVFGLGLWALACEETPPQEQREALSGIQSLPERTLPEDASPLVQETQEAVGPPAPVALVSPSLVGIALPHDEDLPVDHLEQARNLLLDEDQEGAMLELGKALYHEPKNQEALLLLGDVARSQERPGLASRSYQLAAELDVEDPRPLLKLARLALTQKQLDNALRFGQQASKLDPGSADAHNLAGRVWLERSQWQKAILSFEKAVALEPSNKYYRNNLGYAHLVKKDFGRAVAELELVVEEGGAPAHMINNLGLAYEGSGRLAEAQAAFREALEQNPGYRKALWNLDRMQNVAKLEVEGISDEGSEASDLIPSSDEGMLIEEEDSF